MLKNVASFVLSVALLLGLGVGVYYLDHGTGGNVFGPSGLVRSLLNRKDGLAFTLSTRDRGLKQLVVLTNASDAGDLRNVSVTFVFRRDGGGPPLEVSHSWDEWKKGERKELIVPVDRYSRIEMKGTARAREADVAIGNTWSPSTSEKPPTLSDFSSTIEYGVVHHRCSVKNKNDADLTDAELTLTFRPEKGEPVEVKRSVSSWKKGEDQSVLVRSGRYKRIELKGTARVEGKPFVLESAWEYEKAHRPAIAELRGTLRQGGKGRKGPAEFRLTNHFKEGTMRCIETVVELVREDGTKESFPWTTDKWERGETKTIKSRSEGFRYRKMTLKGKAIVEGMDAEIDAVLEWELD